MSRKFDVIVNQNMIQQNGAIVCLLFLVMKHYDRNGQEKFQMQIYSN